MTVPQLPDLLGPHCSVLHNNRLYTFSKSAFLSLPLEPGAKWETLDPGVSAAGAACVLVDAGTPEASLYIVGGIVSDQSMGPEQGYMGIQRWIFATGKWEILPTAAPVAYNLSGHGAAYIADSHQIIVFAGTAYPTVDTPSANTFLISTRDFSVASVPGQVPLMSPIVLQWGRNGALLIGGDSGNTNLNSYTNEGGWASIGQLPAPLPKRGNSGATLLDGPDGSRMLYTFDFTTSPTTVKSLKVVEPGKRKRQTDDVWQEYNPLGAPVNRRGDVSIAYDGDGLVVMSGGSYLEPVLMFDSRKNAWIDTETVFQMSGTTSSSTSSISSSPTPTISTKSTPSASSTGTSISVDISEQGTSSNSGGDKLSMIQILFIVLGSLLFIILLLGFLYWFIMRRRHQQRKPTRKRTSPAGIRGGRTPDPTLSFQDRGLGHNSGFMKEAALSGSTFDPHPAIHPPPRRKPDAPVDSWTAVQFAPKSPVGQNRRPPFPGLALKEVGAAQKVNERLTPTSDTSPHLSATLHSGLTIKGRPGERSSGWSRYFSNITSEGRNDSDGTSTSDYSTVNAITNVGGIAAATAAPTSYSRSPYGATTTTTTSPPTSPPATANFSRPRAASTVSSVSAMSADMFTGSVPNATRIWDPTRDNLNLSFREPVASSVYPSESGVESRAGTPAWRWDERRGTLDTRGSVYSQEEGRGQVRPLRAFVEDEGRGRGDSDLSWLNLRS
ncbi:hypothetical protein EX30DRAFT_198366 [Ascodesmis nigricans]|uniref:Uncharacterized protein n=1 Tax=Ascodesmis nigricans TaxID=341454 RepID=A0A4S2MKX2_9PEZI|nr:hypothetical protein EX30DRAFT_198366 [Ascodesmis nigricans]